MEKNKYFYSAFDRGWWGFMIDGVWWLLEVDGGW